MAPRTGEPIDRWREFHLTRSTDAVLVYLVFLSMRGTGAVLKTVAERMPKRRGRRSGCSGDRATRKGLKTLAMSSKSRLKGRSCAGCVGAEAGA